VIVRIMGVGQYRLADTDMEKVNSADAAVEAAVEAGDEDALHTALVELSAVIQALGTEVPTDEFIGSDVIVPDPETTVEEARQLLSDDGLIPG
jgi:hypothetical protein